MPDFQVGKTTGVLFLSLRYHRLHPEYIHQRIEALGYAYNLRILLLMCDITEHQDHIRELTKMCMINNITIIVTWSADEAGQYLSTFKQFERKPPDLIRERVEREPSAIMRAALTGISRVNKTDVETLRASFGSFANISRATSDQLSRLPGFGPKKVARMKDAFNHPFRDSPAGVKAHAALDTSGSFLPHTTSIESSAASRESGKGKEKANDTGDYPPPSSQLSRRPARSPSPVWDIELDLNSPSPPVPRSPSGGASSERGRKRQASPVWDIELDLNEEDLEDVERASKRRKE